MYFRRLLTELHRLEVMALIEEFTSTFVAFNLRKPIKEVSNDLKRLHQMGFLKRKRKKRRCLSKKGKVCFKGYEYIYSISNQGRSYLHWMRTQKPLEDFTNINLTKEILEHLPQELKNRLLIQATIRSAYRYKGPSSRLRLIDNGALPIAITLLENQNLNNEIIDLLIKNLRLSTETHNLKDQNINQKEINKMYYELLINFNERITQYKLENQEGAKLLFDYEMQALQQRQRKDQINRSMISIYRESRNRIIGALSLSLPEENFNKVMDLYFRNEEDELAVLEQKMNALNAEIQQKVAN